MRTIHQQKVDKFMRLAGQDVPNKIGDPGSEIRKLRAKLILEECIETINALGFEVSILDKKPSFEEIYDVNIVEVADGCADVKVVTTGTLTAFGIDDNEIQEAVDENNLAKFGPGSYRREDGKWMKPPDHKAPNIQGILNSQE